MIRHCTQWINECVKSLFAQPSVPVLRHNYIADLAKPRHLREQQMCLGSYIELQSSFSLENRR
ncbi:hypothetical protein GCM10011369_32930 [Neiella marina]|uniref:Uncharacterized protein n=1 Tax=Neiella marina TaxID=508461 RepID=A0A8J2U9C5_9GAMM|nr:hypothetical protein GCM10011369_32930 [Neiella marina]